MKEHELTRTTFRLITLSARGVEEGAQLSRFDYSAFARKLDIRNPRGKRLLEVTVKRRSDNACSNFSKAGNLCSHVIVRFAEQTMTLLMIKSYLGTEQDRH